MKTKVLYFPYIGLPQSEWSTRMLLYWDEIGAIVPYEFVQEPERLDEYTRSLVQSHLVRQVIPGMYVHRIPGFRDMFLKYLEALGAELPRRRKLFETNKRRPARVHVEKLHDLLRDLVALRVARPEQHGWHEMEPDTAADFMAYLAGCLGGLSELDFAPVTDDAAHLSRFVQASAANSREADIDGLRVQVLERLLPAPVRPLTATQIESFRSRHGEGLKRFRRRVEQEVIAAADLMAPDLRRRRLELFYDEAEQESSAIEAAMSESGFGDLVFGRVCAVASAIPGMHWAPGLAAAIYGALCTSKAGMTTSPFLYAVSAQRELIG